VRDLLHLAENGDPHATAALTRQATYLGRGLRLVTAALSPEVILLAGDFTMSWPTYGQIVQSELESQMLAGAAPRLMVTTDGELARLRGAGAVVLQRHSGYYRSTDSPSAEHAERRRAMRTPGAATGKR
jgi:predicted NBD/HSP70 family sugar kinase